MLYLLLKECYNEATLMDRFVPVWKVFSEFEAGCYQEALDKIPMTDHGYKFKLYEIRAVQEVQIKRHDRYTLVEKERLGEFSK